MLWCLWLWVEVGYCPHPVTFYIRGPNKGIIIIIQLLVRGGGGAVPEVEDRRDAHFLTVLT